jgi:hypothetical protein
MAACDRIQSIALSHCKQRYRKMPLLSRHASDAHRPRPRACERRPTCVNCPALEQSAMAVARPHRLGGVYPRNSHQRSLVVDPLESGHVALFDLRDEPIAQQHARRETLVLLASYCRRLLTSATRDGFCPQFCDCPWRRRRMRSLEFSRRPQRCRLRQFGAYTSVIIRTGLPRRTVRIHVL